METNYIYMTQINHKANRTLSEIEIEKQNRQADRKIMSKRRIARQKANRACVIAITIIMLMGAYFGMEIITHEEPVVYAYEETEEHYVPDRMSVAGIVTDATETGCLIETYDELDGHQWYWEFDDTQYYVGEHVIVEFDRCYTTEIENYQILGVY